MRGRAPLVAALTLALVFVAGALAGAAFERARSPEPQPAAAPPAGGRPPIFAGGPMAERLRLDPAQRDSIHRIVERDRESADTLYREFRPRLRARFDSTTSAIEAVLTPEQRAEWQRMRHERRGEWRRGRERREEMRGRGMDSRRRAPERVEADSGIRL